MSEKVYTLVPRYFPEFHCKMGACRHPCCVGWPISISMANYFSLLGLDCPKDLRDRLDVALRPCEHPTEDRYAQFNPNWLGDCPMRMEDGRCSLHAALGEDVLPDVCRLYPRGFCRSPATGLSCCCSNSCEAVLELLLRERDPMTFHRAELSVAPPPHPEEESDEARQARNHAIRTIQDRSRPLPDRIRSLTDSPTPPTGTLIDAMRLTERLIAWFGDRSESFREATADAVTASLASGEDSYRHASSVLHHRLPDCAVYFEQILVNHLGFASFPESEDGIRDLDRSLAVLHAMLRALAAGCAVLTENADNPAFETALIDTLAAAFRLIEHTPFAQNAAHALRDMTSDPASAASLLLTL